MGLFTFLYQKTFIPQIGEAEAAARRTVQQQQQNRHNASDFGNGSSNTQSRASAAAAAAVGIASHASELATAASGDTDPAVAALLTAAKRLTPQQLARLRKGLESVLAEEGGGV